MAVDLVGEQSHLVLPLRELVSRPSFQSLAAKAGSGSGAFESKALLESMQATFAPQLITAMGEILTGFLDLSADAAPSPSTTDQTPKLAKAKKPPASPDSLFQAQPYSGERKSDQPSPRLSDSWLPASGLLPRLAAIAAASGVLVMGGLWFTSTKVWWDSTSKLCAVLGLCSNQRGPSANQQALEVAANAEQSLRRAQGLVDYRKATEQLERELLKLDGVNLTPKQDSQRQRLQTTAKQARAILTEEESDLARLNRASQSIDAAQASSGDVRSRELSAARQELEGIPPRSFSAEGANRLRKVSSALERQQIPATEPVAGSALQETPAANNAPSQKSSFLPQSAPAPPQSTARETAPNRDQPLF